MAMNPITNAGVIKPMNTADWKKHALQFNTPGEIMAQDMIEFEMCGRLSRCETQITSVSSVQTKPNQTVFKKSSLTSRQWLDV